MDLIIEMKTDNPRVTDLYDAWEAEDTAVDGTRVINKGDGVY